MSRFLTALGIFFVGLMLSLGIVASMLYLGMSDWTNVILGLGTLGSIFLAMGHASGEKK